MLCPVCNSNKTLFFCAHCINSVSDPDIGKVRLQLERLNASNEELKAKIEKLLGYVTNNGSGSGSAFVPTPVSASASEIAFYYRMREINLLKKRRRNDRINTWVKYMTNLIERKKGELARCQDLLVSRYRTTPPPPPPIIGDNLQTSQVQTIAQVQTMLRRRQVAVHDELTSWFLVRNTERWFEIPYVMWFQPIVSLRNVFKLPGQLIALSVLRMAQYLQILERIYSFSLPFTLGPSFTLKWAIELDDQLIYRNLIHWLTTLTINLVVCLQRLDLIPVSQKFPDIARLLDEYDIDGLFYQLANRLEVKVVHTIETPQNFSDIAKITSKRLYSSSESDASQQNGQQSVESADKWFVVN